MTMTARRPKRTTDDFVPSPFIPVAEEERHKAPRATIHPDKKKTWLGRAMPVVLAHKGVFIASLSFSFVGLLVQVKIPDLVRHAFDTALPSTVKGVTVAPTNSLNGYVFWIFVLAFVRGITNYIARRCLWESAYAIEYDFRTLIYAHLQKLSFSFYDRVQSGQLIS